MWVVVVACVENTYRVCYSRLLCSVWNGTAHPWLVVCEWFLFVFVGGFSDGVTPGPFPNPEAKSVSADGTAPGRVWESRSPPALKRYIVKRESITVPWWGGDTLSLSHAQFRRHGMIAYHVLFTLICSEIDKCWCTTPKEQYSITYFLLSALC